MLPSGLDSQSAGAPVRPVVVVVSGPVALAWAGLVVGKTGSDKIVAGAVAAGDD